MHVRTSKLVCDRCGSEVDISPSIAKPFELGSPKRGGDYGGWAEVGRGTHLCPPCHEGYAEIVVGNEERLRRYMERR